MFFILLYFERHEHEKFSLLTDRQQYSTSTIT